MLTAVTSPISSKIPVLSTYAYDQTGMKNAAASQVNNSTITSSTPQVRANDTAEHRQVPSEGKLTPGTIAGGNNSNGQILTTQMIAKELNTWLQIK